MAAYVLKRLVLAVPTIVLVSFLAFAVLRLIPGGVVAVMTGDLGYAGDEAELERALGLDDPFYIQYLEWAGGVVTGDLGTSLWTGRTAVEEFETRLPVTLELSALALLTSALLGIPVGVMSAAYQNRAPDWIGRVTAMLLLSVPNFWIGVLAVVLPAYYFGWTPATTWVPFTEDPLQNLRQVAIPAVILGVALAGSVMRVTRTSMLEVLRQDYVRTAWAKGLSGRTVVRRHVLGNALVPIVTILGLQIPPLIGGSIVIEQIFGLPGIGQLTIIALEKRDFPLIAAINLLIAVTVVSVNLMVDLSYGYLNPRIRLR